MKTLVELFIVLGGSAFFIGFCALFFAGGVRAAKAATRPPSKRRNDAEEKYLRHYAYWHTARRLRR